MPQPVASETRYAATSRRVRVPTGKSKRGCSPRVGFQTASSSPGSSSTATAWSASSPWSSPWPGGAGAVRAAGEPGGRTRTTIALLDEPTSRPMRSSSPSRSAASVVSLLSARSVDVRAVLARADMAGRIEWVAAQGAGRPARTDDPERSLDECACGIRGEPDTQEVGAVLVLIFELDRVGLGLRIDVGLRLSTRLDENPLGVPVPAERQRPGSERHVQRLVEGLLVGVDRGRRVLDDPLAGELDEQASQPLREHREPGLLGRPAHHASAAPGLQG